MHPQARLLVWLHPKRGVAMPTTRNRLMLTPSDEVWALVNEVHKLTGTPKAAIVSEILDQVIPVFANQIQALRMLQDSPREAQRLIQNFANESVAKLAQQSLALDEAVSAQTVKGRRKKGGLRGRTP